MNRCLVRAFARARAGIAGLAVLTSVAASAATITVTSLADPGDGTTCTLRQALSAANTDTIVGTCAAGQPAPTVDVIIFSAALNLTPATPGTITIDQTSMSEAPANFNQVPPTWLLVISTPTTITGPGSAALAINGGGLAATGIGRRTLLISDGVGPTDMPTSISGLTFREGRNVGGGGGCLLSRESLTLNDVHFEACEAVGNASSNVAGGALNVNVPSAGDAKPNATLSNVMFVGNRVAHGAAASASCCGAASFGGGTNFVGSVSIDNTKFFGNSAESNGALRIANGTTASITNTQFISNAAIPGNVGAFAITAMSGTVTLSHGGAVGNSAVGRRGGGLISTIGSAVASGDTVTVSDWSFIGNVAGSDIGGLDILTDTFDGNSNCQYAQLKDVRLTDVYFERNLAAKAVGGLRVLCSGNLAMTGVEMTFNEVYGLTVAGSGGNSAAYIADVGAVTMDHIRIVHNKTYGGTVITPGIPNGGFGVFTVQGPPVSSPLLTYPLAHSFTGSRFLVKDNYADENEAGISLRPNGAGINYNLSDSAFVGNRAKGIVGLFLNATGNYAVSNSTFSGNTATSGAGSLFVNTHAASGTNTVNISSITSARNGPTTGALQFGNFSPIGGAVTPNAAVSVKNAILGQSTFGNGIPPVTATALPGVSYAFANSVVEDGNNGMPPGSCGANGVICNVDAKLEGLTDNNSGAVQTYTHALRPGSPALDAGNNAGAPAFDQRGTPFARIVNGTFDIGAFESPMLVAALPCKLDMNADNQLSALSEGVVLLRAMFGMTGAAVLNGTGITQGQWDAVRNNLNTNCGTSFAP